MPDSPTAVPLSRTSLIASGLYVCESVAACAPIDPWYETKKTPSKLSSRPCIMYIGLCRPDRYRACPARASGRRFAMRPCESLTRNAVAPAA